jgi:guanylate kinase
MQRGDKLAESDMSQDREWYGKPIQPFIHAFTHNGIIITTLNYVGATKLLAKFARYRSCFRIVFLDAPDHVLRERYAQRGDSTPPHVLGERMAKAASERAWARKMAPQQDIFKVVDATQMPQEILSIITPFLLE